MATLTPFLHELLNFQLAQNPQLDDKIRFPAWFNSLYLHTTAPNSSLLQAIWGGWFSPLCAFAFGAGYQAALKNLFPQFEQNQILSLGISEIGGAHPKAIQTTLKPLTGLSNTQSGEFVINGKKQWITLADEADIYLIAASTGMDAQNRPQICLVCLPKNSLGLKIEIMPQVDLVPEISHAFLILNEVVVNSAQILPGDGYLNYIKPFRTIEDLHVSAAIVAWITRCALAWNWPKNLVESGLSLLSCAYAISLEPLTSATTHLILAGYWNQFQLWLDKTHSSWESVSEPLYQAWKRDAKLFQVAKTAREGRTAKAWTNYINA